MSRSYGILTAATATIGTLVVIATFAFGGSTQNWITFGLIAAVTAAATAGTVAAAAQGRRQVLLNAGAAVIGAWTVLVTLGIFSGSTQRWLTFAAGAAVAAVGVLGHAAYDAAVQRGRRSEPSIAPVARAA